MTGAQHGFGTDDTDSRLHFYNRHRSYTDPTTDFARITRMARCTHPCDP
jgi:hypothetical protein